MKNHVLIIDHDLDTCKEIKYNLNDETIAAYYALSLPEGLNALAKKRYEAVILSIYFPESEGLELLKYLRHLDNMPILVLSAAPSAAHKAEVIAAGADAYLSKPLDLEDCMIELYALLRRYTELNPNEKRCYALVSYGDMVVDRDLRTAFWNGQALKLSRRDFDLLTVLMENPNRVLTFERLHELLWDEEYIDCLDNRSRVRNQMKRLRKKLPESMIENVRDIGYRIKKSKE